MRQALTQAQRGAELGEVPVGAVLVREGQLLAQGFNCPISSNDPSAHAEIVTLREAATAIKNYRLVNTTLYVTMEPCAMCAGAIVHARIASLVYGAPDAKWGACGSVFDVLQPGRMNHDVAVSGGVLADESIAMLRDFFRARRAARKNEKHE